MKLKSATRNRIFTDCLLRYSKKQRQNKEKWEFCLGTRRLPNHLEDDVSNRIGRLVYVCPAFFSCFLPLKRPFVNIITLGLIGVHLNAFRRVCSPPLWRHACLPKFHRMSPPCPTPPRRAVNLPPPISWAHQATQSTSFLRQ